MCEDRFSRQCCYRLKWGQLVAPLIAATLLLLLFSLILSPAWAGTPGFVKPRPVGSGDSPTQAIAHGDLDGDGALDIVVGNAEGESYIYFNDGRGNFPKSAWRVWGDTDDEILALAVGDLDGDGRLDIAAIRAGDAGVVYLNAGAGDFAAALPFGAAVDALTSVALGDVDGDGAFDLVCGAATGVFVYLNDGDGGFAAAPDLAFTDGAVSSVALADLDGDGWLDIVAGSPDGANLIYFNAQDGDFEAPEGFGPGDDATSSLAIADFDGDEVLDILVGNLNEPSAIYFNDGAGAFTISVTLVTSQTTGVAAADMDGDGDIDILIANYQEPNLVYFNDGEGDFPITRTFGPGSDSVAGVAVGDFDGDGALDIVVVTTDEQNMVYLNDGGGGFPIMDTFGSEGDATSAVAIGDVNGDGFLDLVVGDGSNGVTVYAGYVSGESDIEFTEIFSTAVGSIIGLALGDVDGDYDLDLLVAHADGTVQIYRNPGTGDFTLDPQLATGAGLLSLAVGDLDGDGDLDLVIGRQNGFNRIYLNAGDGTFPVMRAFGIGEEWTASLALGDLDNDGDLDIVVGNYNEQNAVYLNDGRGNFITRLPFGPEDDWTTTVAVSDMDADGVLDVIVGNEGQQNFVYFNDGAAFFYISRPFGPGADWTFEVAVADLDGDGDLDIVVSNAGEQNAVYLNDGLGLFNWTSPASTFGEPTEQTLSLAVGDMDDDGLPDIVVGNLGQQSAIYFNNIRSPKWLVNGPPTVRLGYPGQTAEGNFYASAEILSGQIDIPYYLYDEESDPVGHITAFYSPDGGGKWYPAVAASGVITQDLAASPWSTGTLHIFTWDVNASGFFGRSDNVVVRIVAYPDFSPRAGGVPGPYHWPYAASNTAPFRVRGNQIRVVQGVQPLPDAQVFRFRAGDLRADPFANSVGRPYVTDAQGYLQGRGELHMGDRLVALAPISATVNYTLYHASAAPTLTGLDAYIVTTPGVQILTVTPAHPLLLFNLDLSLEWDARNDGTFLADLEEAIRRSSEVLYDVSDGQIALGEVRVHQAKAQWLSADVVLYAQNGIRPRASMGGVTVELRDDVGVSGVITNAYGPGQIRMGPNWDPFGQSLAELSADWQRAFAHELAHYLLYLPDNYIGVSATGLPIATDCRGSFMTSTYDDAYSEFLTRASGWAGYDWVGDCQDSVAEKLLARTDWETIRTFYGMLHEPVMLNAGPHMLPLNVTQMRLPALETPAESFAPAFFDLRKPTGELFAVPRAQGYLFKTGGTDDLTDDSVIALGATVGGGDRLKVRGAVPGDRMCVFGPYNEATQSAAMGCVTLQAGLRSVALTPVADWQPVVIVNAVTSETWAITATLKAPVSGLNVQLYPAYGAATGTQAVLAPWAAMTPTGDPLVYTAQMTLTDPAFEGFVRVWVPDAEGQREALTQFFLSPPWGPDYAGGGMNVGMRAWGANARQLGAPVASGDGQVTIFNTDNFFAEAGTTSLQSLSELPDFPLWLSPVGKGYRFVSNVDTPRALMFNYHQRDVPEGYEYTIHIYFQPEGSGAWQRLSTALDAGHNQATTQMPGNGEGIYALAATLDVPLTGAGWNLFGYLNLPTRTVTEALVSISGHYSQVATYDPAVAAQWRIYDVAVTTEHPQYVGLVNDLTHLESPRGYWLYATETITLFLKVPAKGEMTPHATQTPGLPPATFYGPVQATADFTPAAGMPVTATIDGMVCGRGVVTEWAGELAYRIMVAADTGDGCGASGRDVRFEVGGYAYPQIADWRNSRAWYHPLTAQVVQTHIITPTWTSGGTIMPGGAQTVTHGADITFTVMALEDYHIVEVYIDGEPLDPEQTFIFRTDVFTYTFRNVAAPHTIHAEFALAPPETYYIYLPLVMRMPATGITQVRLRVR